MFSDFHDLPYKHKQQQKQVNKFGKKQKKNTATNPLPQILLLQNIRFNLEVIQNGDYKT